MSDTRANDADFIVVDDRNPAAAGSGAGGGGTGGGPGGVVSPFMANAAAVAARGGTRTDEPEMICDNSALVHWAIVGSLVIYTITSIFTGRGSPGWAMLFTGVAVALQYLARQRAYIRVTGDGIVFPADHLPQYVRWEQIVNARRAGNGYELVLNSGEKVKVPFVEMTRWDIMKLRKILSEQIWREV